MTKITIVGAGHVGSQAAMFANLYQLGQVVLLDQDADLARGKALDISQAGSIPGSGRQVIGTADYADSADSDLVVITAGVARRPGMSRDDLLGQNARIIAEVTRKAVAQSPNAVLIVVTNPVNLMTQLAQQVSALPASRVIGMAGVLDSARFRCLLAQAGAAGNHEVKSLVIGDHGDYMVPLISHARIQDRPITEHVEASRLEEIIGQVQNGGTEIVNLLKSGSAYFAPGLAVATMIKAMHAHSDEITACAALLRGEYGISGLYVGVPARLGLRGIREVVELPLTEEERRQLDRSAAHIRHNLERIDLQGL